MLLFGATTNIPFEATVKYYARCGRALSDATNSLKENRLLINKTVLKISKLKIICHMVYMLRTVDSIPVLTTAVLSCTLTMRCEKCNPAAKCQLLDSTQPVNWGLPWALIHTIGNLRVFSNDGGGKHICDNKTFSNTFRTIWHENCFSIAVVGSVFEPKVGKG